MLDGKTFADPATRKFEMTRMFVKPARPIYLQSLPLTRFYIPRCRKVSTNRQARLPLPSRSLDIPNLVTH